MRNACGIGRAGDADMGHFVNIFHRAPLGPLVRDRPAWSYAVIAPDLTGTFVTIDGDDSGSCTSTSRPGRRRGLHRGAQRGDDPVAAGLEDLDVEILASSPGSWAPSSRPRSATGGSCSTGDAAHRTTPDGGVGMNTGMHSAHNLAWKVGAVVSGWAGPDLLDTYETERRAVAEANVAYSARRGGGMIKMVEAVRAGDLDTVRAGIAARPGGGRQGMDLGFRYEEGAVASDGTTPPRSTTRWPTTCRTRARAAARPICGCSATGSACRRSTPSAAASCCSPGPTGLPGARPPRPPPRRPDRGAQRRRGGRPQAPAGRFEALYGVEPDGAVLVRPDGFVGWRARPPAPRRAMTWRERSRRS